MDFELSEEQQLLRTVVERFFADHYQFESRKRYAQEPRGWSLSAGSNMPSSACSACRSLKKHGGSAGGPVETMIVMERSAARWCSSRISRPWCSAAGCCASAAVRRAAPSSSRRSPPANCALPSPIPSGSRATTSPMSRPRRAATAAAMCSTAPRAGAARRQRRKKSSSRRGSPAARRDRDGIGLFSSMRRRPAFGARLSDVDGLRAAEVTLRNVRVGADARSARRRGAAADRAGGRHGIAAFAPRRSAPWRRCTRLTVEYMKTRKQFGVAIGSFQVLQHRAGDMLVALEQARSMAMLAP